MTTDPIGRPVIRGNELENSAAAAKPKVKDYTPPKRQPTAGLSFISDGASPNSAIAHPSDLIITAINNVYISWTKYINYDQSDKKERETRYNAFEYSLNAFSVAVDKAIYPNPEIYPNPIDALNIMTERTNTQLARLDETVQDCPSKELYLKLRASIYNIMLNDTIKILPRVPDKQKGDVIEAVAPWIVNYDAPPLISLERFGRLVYSEPLMRFNLFADGLRKNKMSNLIEKLVNECTKRGMEIPNNERKTLSLKPKQ